MMDFRLPLATLLTMAIAMGAGTAARAVEPDAPERLISRADATMITLQSSLSGASKRKLPLGKDEIKDLSDYYRSGPATLIWVGDSGLNENAAALGAVFKRADQFGLQSHEYSVVDGASFADFKGYPAEWLADAELRMSAAAISYASHAQAGRVIPTSIDSEFLDLKPARPEAKAVMAGISQAGSDLGATLESYHPPHEQFAALKAKLAEARSAIGSGAKAVRIPDGPALGPNTYHPQVAVLRDRFDLPLPVDAPRGGNPAHYYDEVLAEAVRVYQETRGLKADAIVGRETREALNEGTIAVSINALIANMERWRWTPRNLGERHVFINVPEFMFRVMDRGKVVHEERIVAGSPKHPTPVFSDEMETVVFNPYWHVPQSIIRNEIIPTMQNNPGYIDRNNMEVIWLGKRKVDPYMVDWHQVNPDKLSLRQVPGRSNALGQVKFLFPNRHSVYMHDTPTKHLFDRPVRAYSHGCMRVRDPLKFAQVVLGWSNDRIRTALETGTDQHVKLAKKLPVHISYFTAWVDADGKLHGYRDIYGHDASVRVALKLDTQKVLASKREDFEAGERGLQN